MRRHFLVGVLASRTDEPAPAEAADFIEDFSAPVLRIVTRFCPFCGANIAGQPTSTTWTPNPERLT
jgi:hypothetical protein